MAFVTQSVPLNYNHKAFPITTITGLSLRGTRHNDLFSRISLLLLPRKGNGNPLQYSCLGNPMDRGAQWVHGVAKSDMTERLKQNSCPDAAMEQNTEQP